MKGMMSWSAVALMTFFLVSGFSRCGAVDCHCEYYPGGCIISKAAPVGFKCRCRYRGAWTCDGMAFPCVGSEQCPGNLADYCACKLGGGDCGAYTNPNNECARSGQPKKSVAASASCECRYHSGGCFISDPAPFGWKCVCQYFRGLWTCSGRAQQCSNDEMCLGGDYSYCGCDQGGGDCGGYPDKPTQCTAKDVPESCNCNRTSDWNRGFYTVDQLTYGRSDKKMYQLQPITLAEKHIRNYSKETQSITIHVQETLAQTYSFSHTGGIEIERGMEFKASIPALNYEITSSLRITRSMSHTWGESETVESLCRSSFTCNGAPYKHTQCSVTMQKGQIDVPYTMVVNHKFIPNCTCESYGTWTGTHVYNATLISKENDVEVISKEIDSEAVSKEIDAGVISEKISAKVISSDINNSSSNLTAMELTRLYITMCVCGYFVYNQW